MADMQSPQHPLEVLPAMLNLVLLQTAKILRDPDCRNPKQAGLTKRRITEIVTVANQRYHDALDEIEIEILRAKAVMERDQRIIKRQRAEKDRAKSLATESSLVEEVVGSLSDEVINPPNAMLVEDITQQLGQPNTTDEKSIEPSAEESTRASVSGPGIEAREPLSTGQPMPQDSEDSVGLAITIPSDDTKEAGERPKSPEKSVEAEVSTEAPIEIPDAIDVDFESMFSDADPKAIDEAMNFNFDELSTDPAVTQGILNDTSFNDMGMSNADIANLPVGTSEDIDSLLPGVENYLNADADLSDLAIPLATTMPETSQPAAAAVTSATSAPNAEEAAVAETSFDDNFFALGNLDMGATGGDELGDGTLADFDEDFDWN